MASIFDTDPDKLARNLITDRVCAAINALPEKNAKSMAEAAFKTLGDMAVEMGMRRDEVLLRQPNDPRCYFDNGDSYVVAFEAGPYEWAIGTSMAIGSRCDKLVEPYYSFDLCFYPGED